MYAFTVMKKLHGHLLYHDVLRAITYQKFYRKL